MKQMTATTSNLNLYQAAALMRLPPAALYLLASSGVLPCKRKGGEVMVSRDLLVGWARLWGERLKSVYSSPEGER